MKIKCSPQLSSFFLFAVLLVPALAPQSGRPTITLSGKIIGASGKHPVYVALWDAAGFLTKAVQQVRLEPQSDRSFHFQVPAGAWTVSAYEDENENGKLDMGMFGPKEPSGFWHPFHAWRKPRFSDVAVVVNKDTPAADIELHK